MNSNQSTSSEEGLESSSSTKKARILRHPYRRETEETQIPAKLSLDQFAIMRVIGAGSFAKVALANFLPTNEPMVLKTLQKSETIECGQVERVHAEKSILRLLESPFIVGYRGSFQDSTNLYLALEYVPGGELFKVMLDHDRLTTDQVRFYAAEIAFALCDLHAINCVYRDLKPENVVVTRTGHINLADFGCAKIINFYSRTYTLCGTPAYLAPEMVDRKGHSVASDWWQLGVLIYEMMAAYPPFVDQSPYHLYEKILLSNVDYPKFFDMQAISFINSLLNKDPRARLNAKTVKSHPFFAGIDWEQVRNRHLVPPFLPQVAHPFDSHNFEEFDEEQVYPKAPIGGSDLFSWF